MSFNVFTGKLSKVDKENKGDICGKSAEVCEAAQRLGGRAGGSMRKDEEEEEF